MVWEAASADGDQDEIGSVRGCEFAHLKVPSEGRQQKGRPRRKGGLLVWNAALLKQDAGQAAEEEWKSQIGGQGK